MNLLSTQYHIYTQAAVTSLLSYTDTKTNTYIYHFFHIILVQLTPLSCEPLLSTQYHIYNQAAVTSLLSYTDTKTNIYIYHFTTSSWYT